MLLSKINKQARGREPDQSGVRRLDGDILFKESVNFQLTPPPISNPPKKNKYIVYIIYYIIYVSYLIKQLLHDPPPPPHT